MLNELDPSDRAVRILCKTHQWQCGAAWISKTRATIRAQAIDDRTGSLRDHADEIVRLAVLRIGIAICKPKILPVPCEMQLLSLAHYKTLGYHRIEVRPLSGVGGDRRGI